MSLADFDAALTGWGTIALVVIGGCAVFFGWRAANAANDTFRLEAEPKLVVRATGEAKIVARQGLYRLPSRWSFAVPITPEELEPLDETPVFLVDGKAGADGRRLIGNGFSIRPPTPAELNSRAQSPVWPALRIEIRNVGRSPAIQAGLHWNVSAAVFAPDWRQSFSSGEGMLVIEQTDEATTIVGGVGPNDSAFIWFANATGTAFSLKLRSPGNQRDPLNLESGKMKPLSMIATSTFALPAMSDNSI
jgi:hypothetical protein